VAQVVVDPVREVVTHLIVEPEHRVGLGRMVPIEWVEPDGDGVVKLRCTTAEFGNLPQAEATQFLPGSEGYGGYDAEQTLLMPYFGGNTTLPVSVDTVPAGEVAVRRGEQVYATDGPIGEVEGLIVDSRNSHVTHVVLKEGHVFRHKDLAIPIVMVEAVDDKGIRLSVSRREVENLPPVDFHRRRS
jgi:sporulation protein YlmC with PRC-barrel domain